MLHFQLHTNVAFAISHHAMHLLRATTGYDHARVHLTGRKKDMVAAFVFIMQRLTPKQKEWDAGIGEVESSLHRFGHINFHVLFY